jgi:chromosome segregation ATPase
MPSLRGSFDSINITFDAEDNKNRRKLAIIREIERWKQKIDVTEEVAAEVLPELDAVRDHLREVDQRYERLLQIVSRSSLQILHLEREYGMLMASDGEGPL